MALLAREALGGFDDSLEIVQELEVSTEVSDDTEFDALHKEIKSKISADKAVDLTDETAESPESDVGAATEPDAVEPPVDDTEAADDDAVAGEPEEVQEDIDGKRTSVAAETLRSEYYNRLAMESFEGAASTAMNIGSAMGNGAVVMGGYAYNKLKELATVLKYLGLEYGPTVLNAVKKGVVYLFIRLIKTALQMAVGLATFTKRHMQSVRRIESDIKSMREIVATLKAKENQTDLTGKTFTDENVLSWLCVGERPVPEQALKVMTDFMTDVVTYVDRGIESDVRTVQKLIEVSQTGIRGNLLGLMNVSPLASTETYRNSKALGEQSEFTDTRAYRQRLPDRLRFITTLPKGSFTSDEALASAYQASGMYLTVDASVQQNLEGIDYMDLQGVERLLDSMESLCALSKRHLTFYGKVEKLAGTLKFGYRHYYQKLTEGKEAATVRTSLIEYVYLKQSFITRVYLPTVMDVHDFSTSFMVRVSKYLKANLKALA